MMTRVLKNGHWFMTRGHIFYPERYFHKGIQYGNIAL